MIETRKDLIYYLECDRIALGIIRDHPKIFGDEIWKFQIAMRKLDYYSHNRIGIFNNIFYLYYKYYYHNLGIKLNFSIPFNIIGPGLAIVHIGTIVISQYAKLGENCRIHVGVNIGANAKQCRAANIGDNVYLGPGCKIIGDITIGNGVVIGANAVVVNDVVENVTMGGIPARKISDNDSSRHIIKATYIVKNEHTSI